MKQFFISDMDMTLISFKHPLALLKLKDFFESEASPLKNAAKGLCQFFNFCWEEMIDQAHGTLHKTRITDSVKAFAHYVHNKGDLDMRWSRELWIYAASGIFGKPVSNLAILAADEYWKAIARSSCLYEDVQTFFDSQWWKDNYWIPVVVTSSDLRLRAAEKDEGPLVPFVYDPEYSYFKKFDRIPESIRKIAKNNIFIGDPVGKPHPAFWERVFANIGYNPDEDVAVMIGDVPSIDLMGLPLGVVPILIDRDNQNQMGGKIKKARYVMQSFDALPFILEGVETQAKERRN